MGTFHSGKGDLHGITVVVDTPGTRVYIGRCDTQTGDGILLLDVDVHDAVVGAESKEEFVVRSAKFGQWKKLDRVLVPTADIASVQRLGEIPVD